MMVMSMTEAIRAAIVDDEDLGRRKISRMLKEDSEISIVGEFAGGEEAVRALREIKPELLFLDIKMPEMDGFAFLRELSGSFTPIIIFVTAFDQHAVQAFRVHALDYLLKPFDRGRFQEALRRAKEQVRQQRNGSINLKLMELLSESSHAAPGSSPPQRERIMVKSAGRISFLKTDEIDWIEAQGDYVRLYAQGRKFLIREKIGEMEHQFSNDQFIRIHRSTIVNVERIKEMQPLFYGEYAVILSDGTRLTLSRSFREKVFSRLARA
jgi:two-component system, LytTR family, response regulator